MLEIDRPGLGTSPLIGAVYIHKLINTVCILIPWGLFWPLKFQKESN